jgi:hypothetical protein
MFVIGVFKRKKNNFIGEEKGKEKDQDLSLASGKAVQDADPFTPLLTSLNSSLGQEPECRIDKPISKILLLFIIS